MSSIRLDYFIRHMIALPICAREEILAIFQRERARREAQGRGRGFGWSKVTTTP